MKKAISLTLCICLVLGSFSFAFAADQAVSDSTTHSRLQTIYNYISNYLPTYNGQTLTNQHLSSISSSFSTFLTNFGYSSVPLLSSITTIRNTVTSINSTLSNLYDTMAGDGVTSGVADLLSSILDELTWETGNTVYHGIQNIRSFLLTIRNDVALIKPDVSSIVTSNQSIDTSTQSIDTTTQSIDSNINDIRTYELYDYNQLSNTGRNMQNFSDDGNGRITANGYTQGNFYGNVIGGFSRTMNLIASLYTGILADFNDTYTTSIGSISPTSLADGFFDFMCSGLDALHKTSGTAIGTYNWYSSFNDTQTTGNYYSTDNLINTGFRYITLSTQRLLAFYSANQRSTSWMTLQQSTVTPRSAIDGIYSWLANIQTPIARLAYVHASDFEIAAREKAENNENAIVNQFIDSNGAGSLPTSNISDISGISSGIKTNLSTNASPSSIWDVFNSSHGTWFSQETADSLDTTSNNNRKGKSYDTPLLDEKINDLYKSLGVINND